jgi:hypothetical protein
VATKRSEASGYEAYRESQAAIYRERSEHGRDIGPLPKVKNVRRRNRCRLDFRKFCETYFPARFDKPWGRDHLDALAIMQDVVLNGGQFPLAMPRGSGKTTIATTAVLYAVLYGHRRYVVFVASNGDVAKSRLDELIRAEFEGNELLLEDFPEACYPVIRLERNSTRARMQTLDGAFTRMEWGAGELKLPTVAKSASSGARIACAGLESGGIRGLVVRAPDGSLDRPDLVICDDPQTDTSARMPGQCDTREHLVTGAIAGLAGPGKTLAVVVPCTVIRPNDLSDRLLDRKRNPEWYGRKFKLVDKMPDRMDLWQKYGSLLRDGLEEDPPTREQSTTFYLENRAAMDAGCEMPWPDRQVEKDGAVSAVQFAMDLFLLKPAVFAAEYQNEPLEQEQGAGAAPIDPSDVAQKVNQIPRGVVPAECGRLVAMIDPKQEIIYWAVTAFDEKFSPSVVDYGTFPRQHGGHFSGTDPGVSLSETFKDKGFGLEARIYAGLSAAASDVMRDYPTAAGGTARVELCLVDVGWGPLSETIHQWCRQTPFKDVVKASRGRYVGAAKAPMSQWKPAAQGDRKGPGWWLKSSGQKNGREILMDVNFWKSFLAERARSPMGTPGSLTLFGSTPATHKLFADHLGAEYPVRLRSDDGRVVDEWQIRPGRPDNDWLDCMVGCLVAVSFLDLRWNAASAAGETYTEPAKPTPLRYDPNRARAPANVPAGGAKPLRYADRKAGAR